MSIFERVIAPGTLLGTIALIGVTPAAGTIPLLSAADESLTQAAIACAKSGGTAGESQYVVQTLNKAHGYATASIAFRTPAGVVADNFQIVLSQAPGGSWSCAGGNKSTLSTQAMLKNARVPAAAVGVLSSGTASSRVLSAPVSYERDALRYASIPTVHNQATSPPVVMTPGPGQTLLDRLWNAASAFRGTDTAWPGTDNGINACAEAVRRIIRNATTVNIAAKYPGNWMNVDTWWDFALGGGGSYGGTVYQVQNASRTHRGAIIIWDQRHGPKGHIGFCAADSCSATWSNSSSLHTFAPASNDRAGMYNFGEFGPSTTRIWEPANIP
jgi:hypothetical protein